RHERFPYVVDRPRSIPRACAIPSTTALARGAMSSYSMSLAMAASDTLARLPIKRNPLRFRLIGNALPLAPRPTGWIMLYANSVHVLTAVDRQGRASDEAGIIGDQEQHAASNLIGLA